MLARETGRPANVVLVLVRDDDSGKVRGSEPDARQALRRFSQAETTVEQHARRTHFHDQSIALAAATKQREPHRARRWVRSGPAQGAEARARAISDPPAGR